MNFSPKYTFSTKNNPICGVTTYQWYHIIKGRIKYVEIKYIFRVIFISVVSLLNSLLSVIETIIFPNDYIDRVTLRDDPIFIIGHPRTGTTLLHNLLCSDLEKFYFCTTFCAGFPSSFLWFEWFGKRVFSGLIEKTRPMDTMPLHFDLPQEDEIATNLLSCGLTYYMPLWFMKQEKQFRKFIDFDEKLGGTKEDEKKWTKAFIYLLKKLTIRGQRESLYLGLNHDNRRLVLKSPVHTGRISLLRKIFPRAKFVYLHRDPYTVFQSSCHMADTAYWYCYLNTPSNEQILEFILWQFEYLWTTYSKAVAENDYCDTTAAPGADDGVLYFTGGRSSQACAVASTR